MQFIKGYENLYSATEDGFIYSHRQNKNIVGDSNSSGYKRVILCKDKNRNRMFVHRLIAETFIENTEDKRTVNHINGIKTDNSVENLEWATDSEQHLHGWKLGLEKITPNHIQEKNRKISKEKSEQLLKEYNNKTLNAKKEALLLNVSVSAVYSSIYRNKKCKL
jgi:hypothetical protein